MPSNILSELSARSRVRHRRNSICVTNNMHMTTCGNWRPAHTHTHTLHPHTLSRVARARVGVWLGVRMTSSRHRRRISLQCVALVCETRDDDDRTVNAARTHDSRNRQATIATHSVNHVCKECVCAACFEHSCVQRIRFEIIPY